VRLYGVIYRTNAKNDGDFLYVYTLPIVTNALSPIIRPHLPSNICDVGSKILGCSLWSRTVMLGSAESEHPRLTNREIIFEVFQPM